MLRTVIISIASISIFIILTNCEKSANQNEAKPGPNYELLKPSCFIPNTNNPIIKSGDLFAGSTWNDPSVLFIDGQYIMYAGSSFYFDGNVKIFRLISNDGISWIQSPSTPVLAKGNPGAWDDKSVETPSVVRFKNTYHMFYTGYQSNTATDFKIGHAISSDGINWTKSSSNPILDSIGGVAVADDFDQFITAEPGAVVFNSILHVYFTAQGYITTSNGSTVNNQLMTIGLITSTDGSTFSTPSRVFDPDQTLYPRNSNWKGHSTPAAVVLNNKVHLFIDVMYTDGSDTQRKLHHAVSANGVSNWKNDSSSIFSREEFSWTAAEIRSPSVLLVANKVKLWFAGHESLTLGVGLADCSL